MEDRMAAWGYATELPIQAGSYRLRVGDRVALG